MRPVVFYGILFEHGTAFPWGAVPPDIWWSSMFRTTRPFEVLNFGTVERPMYALAVPGSAQYAESGVPEIVNETFFDTSALTAFCSREGIAYLGAPQRWLALAPTGPVPDWKYDERDEHKRPFDPWDDGDWGDI